MSERRTPTPEKLREYAPDMYRCLQQCVGLLAEIGELNPYRNMTHEELGRAWLTTARKAAMLLNAIDGLPNDRQRERPVATAEAPR